MTYQLFFQMLSGLITSIELTFISIFVGFVLAIIITIVIIKKTPILESLLNGFIIVFTGTPLLVQIFLIYYGPAQFDWIKSSFIWPWLSQPWYCAILALSLNTSAYTSQLFKGAFNAISKGQWDSCSALGMTKYQSIKLLLPFAIKRSIPAYSNEVILVFKGTSLVSTITIMDLMGYTQRINAQTYDTLVVFGIAGALYLTVNGIFSMIFRYIEHKVLVFENHSKK
ncbi:arginine transporter permease subunit ArtM [Paraphotobacterium marinum]|uniref:Arginine ABC transporter permease protein ArtM n=1 Tax=Paraphotobacterium marinum TaxID=1755811 RepID=A0A220VAZ3_9GAMM|nr:arginine ABC transporter permease ArtM [Paraphotobacterium marinum]ASK77594.1 arginine transporter permease subunit ArtM [Paraphotobacterium marinum]